MRRPSPLPPSAPDGRDTAPLAPLAPLVTLPVTPSAARGARTAEEPPISSAEAEGEAAPGAPVRWRDLWRASRARRRALRGEMRRFTARARRRRMLWLGVVASVALLAGATVGAAYSPLFAVETVEVVGTAQLAAADVQSALAGQVGTPLAAIDESAVKAALVRFPLIESYTLEARPPHDLIVRIVERTPIGVLTSDAGYTLVDAAGVALSTSAEPPAGYPTLDIAGGEGSAAFVSAGQVMRALPGDVRAQVTHVSATTPDDVTLTLGATNATVVWGSADQSAMKALVLQRVMAAQGGRSSYDVSSPSAVVVR